MKLKLKRLIKNIKTIIKLIFWKSFQTIIIRQNDFQVGKLILLTYIN